MATCDSIKISNKKVCIGDLIHRIDIQERAKTFSDFDNVDVTETFTTIKSTWAAITVSKGYQSFNAVGTNSDTSLNSYTHIFYIRYDKNLSISSENWIKYKEDEYNIISIQNLDERNRFFVLFAVKKGIDTKEANLA